MTSYQILVDAHASVVEVALASFWSVAFLRKGSALPLRAGQVFLLATIIATPSGSSRDAPRECAAFGGVNA